MSVSGVSSPVASASQKYSFTAKAQSMAEIYKAQQPDDGMVSGFESAAKSMNLARGNYGNDSSSSIRDMAKLLDIGQKIDVMV